MTKWLFALATTGLISFYGCTENPADAGATDTTGGTTITYDFTETENGTYTITGTTFATAFPDTNRSCGDDTLFKVDTFTNQSTSEFVIKGDTLVVTELDTSMNCDSTPCVVESVEQEVITLVRQDTGTGIVGTWVSLSLPVVTYLVGSADPEDFDESLLFSNMKMEAVINADGTYKTTFSVKLASDFAVIYVAQFAQFLKAVFAEQFPSVTVTASGTSVTAADDSLDNDLVISLAGGTFPDILLSITYGTSTATGEIDSDPSNQADCDAGDPGGEIFNQFFTDLIIAYGGGGAPKGLARIAGFRL